MLLTAEKCAPDTRGTAVSYVPASLQERLAFLPRRAWCEAPFSLRGCDPPCLSMRNNVPVEHCAAEAFILHREIVFTMKAGITLRAYLTTEVVSIVR